MKCFQRGNTEGHYWFPQGAAQLGAGDYLMSFLGVVILSFGFRIYGQRRLMARHAPEIFGSTIISSAFSLFATAAFARLLGLAPGQTQTSSHQCPPLVTSPSFSECCNMGS